ncbi:hypothetical protein MRX96_050842 [Rhipicephalus microplus]
MFVFALPLLEAPRTEKGLHLGTHAFRMQRTSTPDVVASAVERRATGCQRRPSTAGVLPTLAETLAEPEAGATQQTEEGS